MYWAAEAATLEHPYPKVFTNPNEANHALLDNGFGKFDAIYAALSTLKYKGDRKSA